MKTQSLDEFLASGGQIKKCESPPREESRQHWTQKDKIDVAIGVNRKTGASKRFDQFATAFLGRGNTSWKYGK